MKYIVRGIVIIAGILLVFMLITACAPNKALTKERLFGSREKTAQTSDEEYVYNYDNDKDTSYEDNGSRDTNRERKTAVKKDFAVADEEMNADSNGPRKEKFYQTGIASWYGREFHGKMTASGERFNMKDLTAAHKSLPFGSVVVVKNLDNGREVRVKINDRGPYKKGRILDLSYAAAKKLDILSDGEAMVGINVVKKVKNQNSADSRMNDEEVEPVSGTTPHKDDSGYDSTAPSELNSDSGTFAIQAGAFYSRKNAQNLKNRIEETVEGNVIVVRENELYKVRIEGIRSRKDADRYKKKLQTKEINAYIVETRE